MYSIKCNVETRKNTNNFLSDWNDYNPEGFEYGNLEKFKNNMPDNSNDDEDIYFVTEPSMEQESSDWADMFFRCAIVFYLALRISIGNKRFVSAT